MAPGNVSARYNVISGAFHSRLQKKNNAEKEVNAPTYLLLKGELEIKACRQEADASSSIWLSTVC